MNARRSRSDADVAADRARARDAGAVEERDEQRRRASEPDRRDDLAARRVIGIPMRGDDVGQVDGEVLPQPALA